jgi:hypothetical protein
MNTVEGALGCYDQRVNTKSRHDVVNYFTELNGKRAMVILEDGYMDAFPVAQLPNLSWFCVYWRLVPGGGFWDPDESDDLDALEEELMRLCDEAGHGWAVFVRRLDTYGIREFYFYTGGSSNLAAVLPRLHRLHPEYRIEYDVTSDPEWSHYVAWLREHGIELPVDDDQ